MGLAVPGRPPVRGEFELLDLLGRGPGEPVEEGDVSRGQVPRRDGPVVLVQVRGGEVCAVTQDDEDLDVLLGQFARHPDGRDLGDVRVLETGLLDLVRGDVLAAPADGVGRAGRGR